MGRIYYGWWLVAITFVINMIFFGLTFQSFTLFVLPVSKEFALTRAEVNTAMILLAVGKAVLAPFLGRLIDHLPVKLTLAASALLLGGSLTALGWSQSIWLSAAIFTLPLALALLGAPLITAPLLVNRWFEARRGRAMAISLLGSSLGFVFVAPVVGWLIEHFGWRTSLLLLGPSVTVLLVGLALLVREAPAEGERPPAEEVQSAATLAARPPAAGHAPLSLRAVLRMPPFWALGIGYAVPGAVATALLITFVPLAVAQGFTTMEAAQLVALTGVGAIATKFVLAAIADKVDRLLLLAATIALGGALNIALIAAHGYTILAVCSLVLGTSIGGIAPLAYAAVADRFGTRTFGTVSGLLALLLGVFSALGNRFVGEVYDRTGNYDAAFATFAAAQFGCVGLIVLAHYLTARTSRAQRERQYGTAER